MSEKKETPILKAEHLTKMFPVKKRKLIEKQKYVHAAEDVSFEVSPGEVLGIVGESGSGKSTLARTILALTPSTSGQVFYQGEDITDFKVSAGEKRRLRSEIQMIFQDPYASLNPKQDRQCDRRANAASRSGMWFASICWVRPSMTVSALNPESD